MGFAVPLALLGLALLAVPLAIHLRPQRTRQVVRVGSVRHLRGAPPPARAGLRLTEPVLLGLRLAVVALPVLALAGPFLRRPGGEAGRKVALVAAPAADTSAAALVRRMADSLVQEGFARRELDPRADVWQALRAVDASLPPGSEIALVSSGRVRAAGVRPALASDASVHLAPGVRGAQAPTAASATRRRVTIAAAPARNLDARLVAAAFRAIAAERGDSLELAMRSTADTTPRPASRAGDWLVWLPDSSSAPHPPARVRGNAALLTDGELAPMPGRIRVRRDAAAITVTLAGRFAADSAELMLTGALPELLAGIWPDPVARFAADTSHHAITASQLQPDRAAPPRSRGARAPLSAWLLAAAALLFLAERWMSHRGLRAA
jgi:hypothetical protein